MDEIKEIIEKHREIYRRTARKYRWWPARILFPFIAIFVVSVVSVELWIGTYRNTVWMYGSIAVTLFTWAFFLFWLDSAPRTDWNVQKEKADKICVNRLYRYIYMTKGITTIAQFYLLKNNIEQTIKKQRVWPDIAKTVSFFASLTVSFLLGKIPTPATESDRPDIKLGMIIILMLTGITIAGKGIVPWPLPTRSNHLLDTLEELQIRYIGLKDQNKGKRKCERKK